ncbi:transcriptional regulator [bacterium]|nr:MAG: transcriptional regulator [bacterium]
MDKHNNQPDSDGMTLEKAILTLKKKMNPRTAYYTTALARILGISIPATRRYLKTMDNLGLLDAKRDGRYKVYALPEKDTNEDMEIS